MLFGMMTHIKKSETNTRRRVGRCLAGVASTGSMVSWKWNETPLTVRSSDGVVVIRFQCSFRFQPPFISDYTHFYALLTITRCLCFWLVSWSASFGQRESILATPDGRRWKLLKLIECSEGEIIAFCPYSIVGEKRSTEHVCKTISYLCARPRRY